MFNIASIFALSTFSYFFYKHQKKNDDDDNNSNNYNNKKRKINDISDSLEKENKKIKKDNSLSIIEKISFLFINNNNQTNINKNTKITVEIKSHIINYILDDTDSLKNLRFTNKQWFNCVNQKFFGMLTIKKYPSDESVITYKKMNEKDKIKYICNWKNCFFENKLKEKENEFKKRYGATIFFPFVNIFIKFNIIEFFLVNSERILEHFSFTNQYLSIRYNKDDIKYQICFDTSLSINLYFIKSHKEINLDEVIDNLIKLRNQNNLAIYE
jgi:hypothetical protein